MNEFFLNYSVNNERKTFIVSVEQFQFMVGRDPRSQIFIDDPSVSGRHGCFYINNGQLFYADVGSSNGSFINGKRVSGAVPLQPGSVVVLGSNQTAVGIMVSQALSQPAAPGYTPAAAPLPAAYPPQQQAPSGIPQTPGAYIQPSAPYSPPPYTPPAPSGAAAPSYATPAPPQQQPPPAHGQNQKPLLIGRDATCDVILSQTNVSRFHAKLHRQGGQFVLEDNNSTNGTYVGGVRLVRPQIITPDDVIYIASACLRLKDGMLVEDDASGKGLSVQVRELVREVSDRSDKSKTKIILDHVTLSIESNEFVAIIGGSGAGKSTLMNVLCGKTTAYGGQMTYNHTDAENSRGIFNSVIGFAPQFDILYHDLTLKQMLYYSAKLKMPPDTQPDEYEARIAQVIQMVAMTGHENTLVGNLSGGQRKRAGIAVELLSDPKLYFLDEPTSGLDPFTERNLMRLLKEMTKENKTIVVITHMTQNINLCDKVIILGTGGKLCFFGTPEDACAYFGVTDVVDIYDKINTDPSGWQMKYRAISPPASGTLSSTQSGGREDTSGVNPGLRQFGVLTARYFRLIFSDRKRLLLLLLQAPILGALLMLVSNSSASGNVFDYVSDAKSMLFSLTCAAFWVGMLNSIQEICKERDIYEQESRSTVRMLPYIASKITVIGLISILQSLILTLVMWGFAGGLPDNALGVKPFAGYFFTVCLTTLCAACLGLAISSLSPNPDRAMAIAPLVLLPQILFSGVAFELSGFINVISNVIPCKLSMQNFGVLTNFNALPASKAMAETDPNYMYSVTNSNLYWTWGGLLIFSAVCIVVFAYALRPKDS